MRFSYFLAPLFALSAVGVAAPNPDPAPVAEPQFPGLGDISSTLSALNTLLSGSTLNNIVSLIDNAAGLLTPQFVNETQTLITTLIAALPSLEALLGSLESGSSSGGGSSTSAKTTATATA